MALVVRPITPEDDILMTVQLGCGLLQRPLRVSFKKPSPYVAVKDHLHEATKLGVLKLLRWKSQET